LVCVCWFSKYREIVINKEYSDDKVNRSAFEISFLLGTMTVIKNLNNNFNLF